MPAPIAFDNRRAPVYGRYGMACSSMPHAGAATVNVPGALDGYLELHKQFGTMELADLFEPAAKLVDDGFPVGAKISQAWAAGAPLLRKYSPDSTAYLPGGEAPAAGSIFREQDLARVWRRIGREGRAAFYTGEVRDRIVETVQKGGGYLQAGDFDTVQAEWVEPIRGSYRRHTILEMPPNGQGIVALEALAILEGYDMASICAASWSIATALELRLEPPEPMSACLPYLRTHRVGKKSTGRIWPRWAGGGCG